jgi:2-hydroxy-4-carboxymuconate semialdehyde hemiacetal dehydrogenase
VKICLAGEGAMGGHHVRDLNNIEGVEIASLAFGIEADGREFADKWSIPHMSSDLEECLSQPDVEAVVLATPNQVHAQQAETALKMGKHVLVEIPMALNLEDSQRLVELAKESGLVCMVNHSYLYNPNQRKIYQMVHSGELHLHHVIQQTYFFRRTNTNMHGKPRTWTDELLWHQACHMIAYVTWLLDDPVMDVWGRSGPNHATLDCPMDVTISMQSKDNVIVSSANSFNNHGPITGFYRFIGEEATHLIEKPIGLTDHEGNAIETEDFHGADEEFIQCIREGRESLTSVQSQLHVMDVLDRIQKSIDEKR